MRKNPPVVKVTLNKKKEVYYEEQKRSGKLK